MAICAPAQTSLEPIQSLLPRRPSRKDRRLNIRISTKDLEAIQKRALEEDLPIRR